MTKTRKICLITTLLVFAAVLVAAAFVGCASNTTSTNSEQPKTENTQTSSNTGESRSATTTTSKIPTTNTISYDWISFEIPLGWTDTKESASYVTVCEDTNSKHVIKVFKQNLNAEIPNAATYAKGAVLHGKGQYTDKGTIEINGRTWYLVGFNFNDKPSISAYTDYNNQQCVYFTAFEMTNDDDPVKTLMSTISLR